ncbi:MAG: hypothetical protein NTZ77_02245 [Caldiserica bacterium]|jgi:predicted nucleotidyltransferase|nr:hypothetical protein [Caldisericota bacterium]
MLFDTLVEIARALNRAGVHWGVGASVLLYYRGLVEKPYDIDIMIDEADADMVAAILDGMGSETPGDSGRSLYSTSRFFEYVVDGTEVDIMAGLAIKHTEGTYVLPFDDRSVAMTRTENGVTIPFTSLEDWYVLYQLIPGREAKVKLIEEHLQSCGIADLPVLDRALARELPPHVRARIERLVASRSHPQH